MIKLLNEDCKITLQTLNKINKHVDLIYADVIYESTEFSWVDLAYERLCENGILYVQTDQHTVANWKLYLDKLFGKENFINWIITIQEWGGTSKRFFPRKHDDILMYSKGKEYKFYPDRIQIPKVTAGTNLDKKGTGLKTPCDVFYDLGNFPTTAKERVKGLDGKNIHWQKSYKLINRLLSVCTDPKDVVFDPFMGSGTTGIVSYDLGCDFIGTELNNDVFKIAKKRINDHISKFTSDI